MSTLLKAGVKLGVGALLFALLVPLASANETQWAGEGKRVPELKLPAIAQAWGIELATLEAEIEAGKTLPEIAKELGIQKPDILPGNGGHGKDNKAPRGRVLTALAETLGISMEELHQQLSAGTKLQTIAEGYGLDFKAWVKETFGSKNHQ